MKARVGEYTDPWHPAVAPRYLERVNMIPLLPQGGYDVSRAGLEGPAAASLPQRGPHLLAA